MKMLNGKQRRGKTWKRFLLEAFTFSNGDHHNFLFFGLSHWLSVKHKKLVDMKPSTKVTLLN